MKLKESFSKLIFFFSTKMKMDAYRNFTRSETAQRGNAFSISRDISEISAHFFPHSDIFPNKMTPDKTVQLLMKKIHFLTLGDGCLFPIIKTSCSRELFAVISCSRGNCRPLGIALSNLRTVSKAALPITCFF